jgi:hypothetical protein
MRDEVSEIYDRLAALNLPAEAWQLIARLNNINMMHPDHIAAETRRIKDAERKKEKRASEKMSADSTDAPIISLDINSEGGVGETKPPCPRTILGSVVDDERARAIVEHRTKLRKPLTAYAASKLAAKLAKCPDPNHAADEMIAHGWQGVRPEWLVNGKDPPKVVDFEAMKAKRPWSEQREEYLAKKGKTP